MSCISIDWLQIHVEVNFEVFSGSELSPSGLFKIAVKDIRHNVFKQHREILTNITGEWEVCAVLSFDPLSGILPGKSGHIKIINKYLYQSDLNRMVDTLLRELKLNFRSVSRLDVSCDIRKFKDISVPQFFKKILEKKYLKRHCTSFHLDGKCTLSMPIHYMRFGSKHSEVQFYIYNKSKELREKTDKPYIREKWKLCGLNSDHYDVWRVEFVLHPSQFGLIHTATGEAIEFNSIDVVNQEFIEKLFYALMDRHCHFVHNEGHKHKERMKSVLLLKKQRYDNIFIRVSEKQTSNRMDKVFIRKLYELNHQWRIHNSDPPFSNDLLESFIEKKDLRKWFEERFNTNPQNINDENFSNISIGKWSERSDNDLQPLQ